MAGSTNTNQGKAGKVVVIGAGISGLAAAWFLHREGVAVEVLEGAERVGGVIATERFGDCLVELGPNSTLQRAGVDGDSLARLIAEVGLGERLVEPGARGNKRFVMRDGRLHALPGSPPTLVRSNLFSWRAKLRLVLEPFIASGEGEETIAGFVERRLGREFLDYAVEPFVSGVYAGDPRELSVQAAVPRVYELERRFGSLIRGAIALRRLAKGTGGPAGRLVSFDRGMAALPEAIKDSLLAGTVRAGRRAVALSPSGQGWEVDWQQASNTGVATAEAVVLAVPAPQAAELVEPLSAEAAELLRAIAYAPIVSVALAYDRAAVGHALDGFGFLVPRKEGVRLLGGLFSSSLFPGRAPTGKVLITAFLGGATDPEAVGLGDARLVQQAQAELARALEITGEPSMVRVTRHARAIPQYTLGHLDRVARIDRALGAFDGLHFSASWRGGISVADCVSSGASLAARLGRE